MTSRLLNTSLALSLAASTLLAAKQQELPRFRASVDVTSVDVGVFDQQGHPVEDLKPDDFLVRIDGAPRRVISAEWVHLETTPSSRTLFVPEGYSSNENLTGGRLLLIVIDQPNIRFGGTAGIQRSVNAFIDHMQPSDRAAIVGIGQGASATPFTGDRALLKRAVARMVGQYQARTTSFHDIGVAEALDIERSTNNTLGRVVDRECRDNGVLLGMAALLACQSEITMEAREIAESRSADGRNTIGALRTLLTGLRQIDAPKTLVFVSEGFIAQDWENDVIALGSLAAAARTSIYALKLDDQLFSMLASEMRTTMSRMDDRSARAQGLELLVDSSRGSLFNVVGDAKAIFERIETELSGYYLLGLESGATDRDGKPHPIRVEVGRKGVSVRARRALITSSTVQPPKNSREAVMAALSTPLPVSGLPIRIATFSLQGPEAGKVQLLIHADVGADYSTSKSVAVGSLIMDPDGRVVDSQATTARLPPVMNGVPSPLQYTGGASLPPGHYVLKLAVAEGDRVGTIEHAFTAETAKAGSVDISDLMVGGPTAAGPDFLQPTVGYSVVFGTLHGYLEAYGNRTGELKARYEVEADGRDDVLLEEDVPARRVNASRAIFTHVMPVRQLPPGKYRLRVTLSSDGEQLTSLTRGFEVGTPAVLMTSATAVPTGIVSDVYLPVSDAVLARAFDRSEAARASTVQTFRARVPEAMKSAFDKGVRAFASGAYSDAESSFKSALSTDEESSAVLAYMAATFAASGHDLEAAGAWQTALVDGSEFPEIYDWLAGSLLRTRDMAMARTVLEEASKKWPSDTRFTRAMALVYATFGLGPEAVRSLERYLANHREDVESLGMAIEWLYQLRVAGVSAHSPEEDTKLARDYAALYAKAKGPQLALVKRWLDYLEHP